MTITLTPIVHGDLCHGARWTVDNIDILAGRVARVALGQYRHVANILAGLGDAPPAASAAYAVDAQHSLKIAANGDTWQRDGWLFQVISWITANQQKTEGVVIKAPHIFHAHKGFDGMQLEISADGKSVAAVVVFEDKATINPRDMIYSEVWPSLELFETGQRVTQLSHEATGLLEAHQRTFPNIDVDDAIDRIVWQEARRYRVSITTGPTHSADKDRQRLFDGYDGKVGGDVSRRWADTMHFDDLRKWMNEFSDLVSQKIDEAVNV